MVSVSFGVDIRERASAIFKGSDSVGVILKSIFTHLDTIYG